MALTNFDATTPVTAAYLNGFVNQLPRTAVLARSSKESEATAATIAFTEMARLKLRPMQGDYLHLNFEIEGDGALAGTVRTVFEYLGGQVGAQDHTPSGSFGQVTRSVNMTSVGGNNLTGEDVDLVFYGKKATVGSAGTHLRSILAISSDQASPASSGQ